jgi:hypothetical protein
MFTYYQNSELCYVYLDIVVAPGNVLAEDFRQARWTYRGW